MLVASQQTYGAPFTPALAIRPPQRMKAAGQHVIYLPGVATLWHTPAQLVERATAHHRASAGVFFYEGHSWKPVPTPHTTIPSPRDWKTATPWPNTWRRWRARHLSKRAFRKNFFRNPS